MALVPEYLYPNGPKYMIGKGGDQKCGLLWSQPYQQSSSFSMVLYDPIDVAIEVEIGVNTSLANASKKTIFEWPNEIKLILSAYFTGQMDINFYISLYYNNTELTQQQVNNIGLGNFYQKYLSGVGIPNSEPITSTKVLYNMRFFWVTDYFPAQPTENVTPANDVLLVYFIPTAAAGMNIFDLNTLSGEVNMSALINAQGASMPWHNVSSASSSGTNILSVVNLTTFNTGMKTAGSGTDQDMYKDTDDPEDDTSGTGGGGGSYDPTSDPIDFPTLPTGGALTSGMIKGFVIGQGNLVLLQQKLWNMSLFDIETQFQKLVNQPLECIISLHCLPCLPTMGNTENIKLGSFDTEVTGNRITNQYLEINAGSLNVPKYWGSALDYAPFSRAEIFVPFVGFRNLQIEDIQGLTLTLKYHVDVLTGDCVAYLKCGDSVLYSWTGNCLSHVPVMASSSDRLAKGIAAVGSIGVGMVTGNPASTAAGVISAATNVVTAKNHVQRSGDVAGSPGIMSDFTPYIVFHRPKQSLAKNYNIFKGYPSNITYNLGSLSGYTEIEHIHLTDISGATDTELQEIEQLLKNGVII